MGLIDFIKTNWEGMGVATIVTMLVQWGLNYSKSKREVKGLDIDNVSKSIDALAKIVEIQERQIISLYKQLGIDTSDEDEGEHDDQH